MARWLFLFLTFVGMQVEARRTHVSNVEEISSSSRTSQLTSTKESRIQESSNLLDPLPANDGEEDPEPFILPLHDVGSPPGGSLKRLDQRFVEPATFPEAAEKGWWENWWNWLFAGVDS